MLDLETVQRHVAAVMDALVETAVTELSRLLHERGVEVMAAPQRCFPAGGEPLATVDEDANSAVTAPEDRQELHEDMTKHFAFLLKSWTRGAVQKISMMLKLCAAEHGSAGEKKSRQNDKKKQTSVESEAGPVGRSRGRRKKNKRGPKGGIRQEEDHVDNQDDQQTEEPKATDLASGSVNDPVLNPVSISGSSCVPEAMVARLSSDPGPEQTLDGSQAPDGQDDTGSSTTTSKVKQSSTGSFQCPSCDKTFALKCLMDRHYLTHTKPHLCSECGKRFSGLRGLVAHSRRHTGEKLFRCSDCGTEFAYKFTYERHMRQHSVRRPSTHACTLCENQFPSAVALHRHRCCALKKTFVCSACPETFECRQRLADHENLHSGDRNFVCEMCGERFLSSASLAAHRVTHAQTESCCDVLGLGCSDASVLRSHLSKHTGQKLFTCEVCGKGCSHQSALKHHMLTHTGERPYVCEACGKRCGHASALQNHMRTHTGRKPGQQPVCGVCGKKFSCMVNLKYHMSVHTGEKPYSCDQCDKKFSNPSNLRLHAAVHSGEKMYGCNVCGRRFTQSSSLRVHRLIHTGERPHRCPVCDKGFLHSADLKKHQRAHLPEELQTFQAQ